MTIEEPEARGGPAPVETGTGHEAHGRPTSDLIALSEAPCEHLLLMGATGGLWTCVQCHLEIPVEGLMSTKTNESEIAAAICYLMLLDAATLDPDGDLTAAFWPYDLDEYLPGKTRRENIEAALAHLEVPAMSLLIPDALRAEIEAAQAPTADES